MLSYWEQQSFIQYDVIIIGGGIVGMSTALEWRKKEPTHRILILDRGFLPIGASTRNAGFACMGSLSEMIEDLKTMSKSQVFELFSLRKKGLEILRQRLGDKAIDYQENGSHELINEEEMGLLDQMDDLNKMLEPATGFDVFSMAGKKNIERWGFSKTWFKEALSVRGEGQLNTGKMIRALVDLCITENIEIRTGANVKSIHENEKEATVVVEDHFRNADWHLKGSQVFVCTNAFTTQFLKDENVKPGRGQIIITQRINNLPIRGIYHFDRGYYYFREIDERVLFGGGRLLDIDGETTTEIELQTQIVDDLEEKLRTLILPNRDFKIESRWSGIMAFGDQKFPIIKTVSPHVHAAFRLGGMGVAMGSAVAKDLVSKVEQ